jgi:hypothetical protein
MHPTAKHMPLPLMPPNFVGQFAAESDELARQNIMNVVTLIVSGSLSPDTDSRAQWRRLFWACSFPGMAV